MLRSLIPLGASLALVGVTAGPALANGRPGASTDVAFRPGDSNGRYVVLPLTFGLTVSADDGGSFYWLCEEAVGYGGDYDPAYAVAADGTMYAGVFDALRISRDGGCTWTAAPAPLDGQWVNDVEIGSDGWVWAVTASTNRANDVYVSDDEGLSFRASNLLTSRGWWRSIKVAPSQPARAYVAGYQLDDVEGSVAMLRRTDDGGATWRELSIEGLRLGPNSLVFFEAVSPKDPDTVYARTLGVVTPSGDVLYRSTDAGESWTEVLELNSTLTAFVARADGTSLIAGTTAPCTGDVLDASTKGCVRLSDDRGATWRRAATEPIMGCVGERADGALFACGSNYAPDRFALGRSADGERWDPVVQFSQLAGPLSCAAGTVQFDLCESLKWPSIREVYAIGAPDAGPPDAPAGRSGGGGCGCSMAFAAVVFARPRRRRAG